MTTRNVYDRLDAVCEQMRHSGPTTAREMLNRMVRDIVLDAAAVCELRSADEAKSVASRSEAIACAAEIRHRLLNLGVVTVTERSHE